MDNEILRLIKVITLLYLCGYKEGSLHQIEQEVRKILSLIKVDTRLTQQVGAEENIIENLRNSAEWMLHHIGTKLSLEDIITTLRVNCRDNAEYMLIIEKTLRVEINPEEIDNRIHSVLNELRFITKRDNAKRTLQIANARLNFSGEYLDMQPFLADTIAQLSEINTGMDTEEIPGLLSTTDFGDTSQIKRVLEKSKVLTSPEGIINTGLHGLNQALGGYGIIRGWMYNCGAVSFGYKTGHLHDNTMNVATCNTPWLWDPTKKPLIFRCSVETTDDQDTKVLFQRAWYRDTGEKIPLSAIDVDQGAEFLKDYFSRRGYHFVLVTADPNKFSIFDLIKVLDQYIRLGYEIHMCVFDYITKVAKHTPAPREDIKLSLSYDILRSYCYPKGITVVTAAQLDSTAKKIAQENPAGCTKIFAAGSWYADSKSIYNELDVEILSNVVQHIDGKAYWSASRGKHRDHEDTPMNKRDFYYEFSPGGICPDIHGESKALYRLPNSASVADLNIWDD